MLCGTFAGHSGVMSLITTIATVFGGVVGAAFLLAGGIAIPLWEQLQTRPEKKGSQS